MKVHVLTIIEDNDLAFCRVRRSRDVLRIELLAWVRTMWNTDAIGFSFNAANPDNCIASYFDASIDFRYHFSILPLPGVVLEKEPTDEILLTPGMCELVHRSLLGQSIGNALAYDVLSSHGEVSRDELGVARAAFTLNSLVHGFEA